MHQLVLLTCCLITLVLALARADSQYLTCERDADCWSLQKQSRWCEEMVKCNKGHCTTLYRGPCNTDLETCDLERRKCNARYCARDDNCPGGYCDEFRMRCAAGVRPVTQTIKASSPGAAADLPGDQSVSFTGPGAWTYYITLAGSLVFSILGTAMAFFCCIL